MNVSMPIAAVMLDLGFPPAAVKAVPILARTAGLLAHLAEEQQHPLGFLMAGKAEEAIEYEPTRTRRLMMLAPEVESPPVGRAARRRRRRATAPSSPTCSSARRSTATKLTAAGFASAAAAGGLADIAQLPLTEKQRDQGDVHAGQPDRRAPVRDAVRDRPHLLDERHHRHAQLHPAHRRRSRQLGDRLGAQLRGLRRRRRPAHRLHLQRRAVRGRARRSPRSTASASATSRSAPATPSA